MGTGRQNNHDICTECYGELGAGDQQQAEDHLRISETELCFSNEILPQQFSQYKKPCIWLFGTMLEREVWFLGLLPLWGWMWDETWGIG